MSVFYVDLEEGLDSVKDHAKPTRNMPLNSMSLSYPILGNTIYKYGVSSLDYNNGNQRGLVVPFDDEWDFHFGTGQFTVEAWIYVISHSTTTNAIVMGNFSGATGLGWDFGWNNTNNLGFQYGNNAAATTSAMIGAAYTPALNTWIHIAVDRDASNMVRVYADGVVIASGTVAFDMPMAGAWRDFVIGNDMNFNRSFKGHIGGVRVTKGVARYAGAFTPPTAAFPTNSTDDPSWANTVLCLNFDEVYDGSTFAKRLRTIHGATYRQGIAVGDEIRLKRNKAPHSLGNMTWTTGSRTLTLATAKTLTIENCEVAWTASANVTCSTSTTRKQGTVCANIAVATAFTTGKAAYRTLPAPLDLSAFEAISMWFKSSSSVTTNGVVEIRFCSDTTGDVPVHTITHQQVLNTSWRVLFKDFQAPLSVSIASISVWVNFDPGSVTFSLDNIIACKSKSHANHLSHTCLVGKNTEAEPEWHPIMSIDGTTLEYGSSPTYGINGGANNVRPYRGVTETVESFALIPVDGVNQNASLSLFSGATMPSTGKSMNTFSIFGSSSTSLYMSGGWNSTDMSTKDAATWLSGGGYASTVFLSTLQGWEITDIGITGFTASLTSGNVAYLRVSLEGAVGTANPFNGSISSYLYLDVGNVIACESLMPGTGNGDFVIKGRRISNCATGIYVSAEAGNVGKVFIDRIDNCATLGVGGSTRNAGKVTFYNTVFDNNTTGDVQPVYSGAHFQYVNCEFYSATPVYTFSSPFMGDRLKITNFNKVATDHRQYSYGYTIFSDTTVRHTASGFSWKISVSNTGVVGPFRRAFFPLGRRYVNSGVPVTLKCWLYRSSTTMVGGLRLNGGEVGLTSDHDTAMTAAAATWEEVSITFTPTYSGVVELEGYAYGDVGDVYFDDVSVA